MSSQVTSRNLVEPCWQRCLLQRVPKNTSPAIGLVSEMLWHCSGSGAGAGHLVRLQLELEKGWVLRPLGCLCFQKKLSTGIMCHPNCGVFLEIDEYAILIWGAYIAEVTEILALRSERSAALKIAWRTNKWRSKLLWGADSYHSFVQTHLCGYWQNTNTSFTSLCSPWLMYSLKRYYTFTTLAQKTETNGSTATVASY